MSFRPSIFAAALVTLTLFSTLLSSVSAGPIGQIANTDEEQDKNGPVSTKDAKKLTRESLLLFNDATQRKDFRRFQRSVAKTFGDQNTAEQFQALFQTFIDKQIDLSEIKNLEPAFTAPPKINSDGFLVLDGTYPTKPLTTVFNLQYAKEEDEWKLAGIRVRMNVALDTTSEAATTVPSQKEAARLVEASLLDFDAALEKKSFVAFHKHVATIWQKQTTAGELKSAFQDFIDKGIYMSGIKDLNPVFDPAPEITREGILLLRGYYPSKPLKLTFELKYVVEETEWKLIGLNVDVQ